MTNNSNQSTSTDEITLVDFMVILGRRWCVLLAALLIFLVIGVSFTLTRPPAQTWMGLYSLPVIYDAGNKLVERVGVKSVCDGVLTRSISGHIEDEQKRVDAYSWFTIKTNESNTQTTILAEAPEADEELVLSIMTESLDGMDAHYSLQFNKLQKSIEDNLKNIKDDLKTITEESDATLSGNSEMFAALSLTEVRVQGRLDMFEPGTINQLPARTLSFTGMSRPLSLMIVGFISLLLAIGTALVAEVLMQAGSQLKSERAGRSA